MVYSFVVKCRDSIFQFFDFELIKIFKKRLRYDGDAHLICIAARRNGLVLVARIVSVSIDDVAGIIGRWELHDDFGLGVKHIDDKETDR